MDFRGESLNHPVLVVDRFDLYPNMVCEAIWRTTRKYL